MSKSGYISNSAKLMSVVAVLLFAANALIAADSFDIFGNLSQWGTSLTGFTLYAVLIIGFIAFNGEGVGHKRYRDRKSKKVTDRLKLHLFFCFFLNFFKRVMEISVMQSEGARGIFLRFLMSAVSTVGSYGFLLVAVSLWYIFRDGKSKELLPIEITAFVFGIIYNLYKLFNYAVARYGVDVLGDLFIRFFSNNAVLKVLCLLQLLFDILMFVRVCIYYGKIGDAEQKTLDSNIRELPKARNIYKDEGYGIDTLEDDFLA